MSETSKTSIIPPGFSFCFGCGQMFGSSSACHNCTPPPPSNVDMKVKVTISGR